MVPLLRNCLSVNPVYHSIYCPYRIVFRIKFWDSYSSYVGKENQNPEK